MSATQAQEPHIDANGKLVADGQIAPLAEVVIDGETLVHVRWQGPWPVMYRRVGDDRNLLEPVGIDWYAEGGAKIVGPKAAVAHAG